MKTETLDIRTKVRLVIKADLGKNFTVVFNGFDNLDTDYTLTLTSQFNSEQKVDLTIANGGIVLDTANKKLTLVFSGDDYVCGNWGGLLESVNKDADVFYRNEITLTVE